MCVCVCVCVCVCLCVCVHVCECNSTVHLIVFFRLCQFTVIVLPTLLAAWQVTSVFPLSLLLLFRLLTYNLTRVIVLVQDLWLLEGQCDPLHLVDFLKHCCINKNEMMRGLKHVLLEVNEYMHLRALTFLGIYLMLAKTIYI